MDELSRAGVVALDERVCDVWLPAAPQMLRVVNHFHGTDVKYQCVGPIGSAAHWQDFRAELYAAAPGLEEFAYGLKKLMQTQCAVFIPRVGLDGYTVGERAKLAYALASCVGNPTATDKKQVIWDVQARKRDSTYFSTFSETDGEAAYHTDTQYYPEPEPTFILYCMQPARCGGGYSSTLDARALRRDIEKNKPWISKILTSKSLPFRVPSAFVTTADIDTVEATLAPVFSDLPLIRYRRDTLAAGLSYFPEYGDADAHRALDAFELELEKCEHQAEFFLPKDSLLLMDNHRALHARTSFQDHERHILRIRMRDHSLERKSGVLPMVRRRIENLSLSAV